MTGDLSFFFRIYFHCFLLYSNAFLRRETKGETYLKKNGDEWINKRKIKNKKYIYTNGKREREDERKYKNQKKKKKNKKRKKRNNNNKKKNWINMQIEVPAAC